jgi:hypothetical protein
MLRKILLSACAVAGLYVTAAPADAQTRSDRATYFTFSQPVALPRITLPAGKYLFRILDSQATRTVVQVFNDDGTKLYSMFLTIPAERSEPSDEPEVRFLETSETSPAAISTWWYPGEKTGWEFVYPREQAVILAKASNQPVLATTGASATVEDMRKAELMRVSPSGETTDVKAGAMTTSGRSQRGEVATGAAPAASHTPQPQSQPAQPQAEPARPQTPPPAQPQTQPAQPQTQPAPRPTTAAPATQPAPATPSDPASQPARDRLPQTFGFLPLIGVIGGIALVAGMALKRRNRGQMKATAAPTGSTSTPTDYHRGV